METHVKVLAVLYIVVSSLFVMLALLMILMFGGVSAIVGSQASAEDAAIAVPILGVTGMAIASFFLAIAIPGLITGYGLLKRASWARIVGIVLSALHLINFPIGTVLGVYGLWVLLNKDSEGLFDSSSAITTV